MAIADHWSFTCHKGDTPQLAGEEIALVSHPATGLAMLVMVPDHDGLQGVVTLADPVRDVVLVTCGNVVAMAADLDGQTLRAGPHSNDRVTFVPAGTRLSLHHHRDSSMIAALILPAGRLAAMVPGGGGLSAPFCLRDDAWLAAHAMQMGRHVMRQHEAEAALIERMTARLALALAAGSTPASPPPHETRMMLPPGKLRRVLSYVDENLARPIALRDMAGHAGLSSYHFARAFKHATGRAPYDHVFRRRIVRSTALIARTDLKFAEISASTGFASAAHFSQAFQREAGVSPSQFRAVIRPHLMDGQCFGRACASGARDGALCS